MDPQTASALMDAAGNFLGSVQAFENAGTNKKLAKRNRDTTLRLNALNVTRSLQQNRAAQGADRAAIAASGLSLDGSALDILENNAVNRRLDTLLLDFSGQTQAYGYEVQAQQYAAQQRGAAAAGMIGAVGNALKKPSPTYTGGNTLPSAWDSGGNMNQGWYSTQAESSARAQQYGITWGR